MPIFLARPDFNGGGASLDGTTRLGLAFALFAAGLLETSTRSLTAARVEQKAYLLCLRTCNHSLLTWLASCLATPSGMMTPHGVLYVYLRSCAKKKCTCFEKQKLAQVDESEFEQTHPRAFDPFP
jgi:hypothetical protein